MGQNYYLARITRHMKDPRKSMVHFEDLRVSFQMCTDEFWMIQEGEGCKNVKLNDGINLCVRCLLL